MTQDPERAEEDKYFLINIYQFIKVSFTVKSMIMTLAKYL